LLLLGRASRSPLQGQAVTVSGLDHLDYEDVELLTEVHRLTSKMIAEAGSVPAVGSADWRSAREAAKVAGLLVLAEARLMDDPRQVASEQLRAVSVAISGGMDWRTFGQHHVPHTELQRRRGELGSLHQPYVGGRVAWETSTQETAA
jgi:hypothetical protein